MDHKEFMILSEILQMMHGPQQMLHEGIRIFPCCVQVLQILNAELDSGQYLWRVKQ